MCVYCDVGLYYKCICHCGVDIRKIYDAAPSIIRRFNLLIFNQDILFNCLCDIYFAFLRKPKNVKKSEERWEKKLQKQSKS